MSQDKEPNEAAWTTLCALVIVGVGVFHCATIREGHDWGGDFAMYIAHARNIAEGQPYGETGYIYSPHSPVLGPRAYPPMFPLVLAPVYAMTGLNLTAFKIALVVLFCGGLWVASRLFRSGLSARSTSVLIAVIGFSPYYWNLKDQVVSEHLFQPVWYSAVLLACMWYSSDCVKTGERLYRHAALLGLLTYITCATRSAGIVLLPTLLIVELVRWRRITRFGWTAFSVAAGLLLLQRLAIPEAGGGYVQQLQRISVKTSLSNFYQDVTAFSVPWDDGRHAIWRRGLAVACSLLFLVGYWRDNRKQVTFLGVSSALYFALIVLWPSARGPRMVTPLFPAYAFYVMRGCCVEVWGERLRPLLLGCLVVLGGGSYLASYRVADYSPIEVGPTARESEELFAWIRSNTEPDEVLLFFKPRVLALYTERRASGFPEAGTVGWRSWATTIQATVVITRRMRDENEVADPTVDGPVAFENSWFRVHRIETTDDLPEQGTHEAGGLAVNSCSSDIKRSPATGLARSVQR